MPAATTTDPTTTGGEGLSAVTVSGDFGEEPEVTWDEQMDVDELESETLVTGDGPALEDGQQVLTRLLIANGFTKTTAYSTFGKDAAPDLLTVGGDLSPAISKALDGKTIGSRVAVAAPPEDAFGEEGNSPARHRQRRLGALRRRHPRRAARGALRHRPGARRLGARRRGRRRPRPDWTSRARPSPTTSSALTTLVEGDGPPVEKGQTVYVNYLGQVYGAKEPFDASYEREAFSFVVGAGGGRQGLGHPASRASRSAAGC